ncbi:unnamed protein product [Parnassius apollo]|uniref:(apollo) hypothetical protein n=1 Tax=Parnassius apollo TaxID=110799 RepID=A0A8S3XB10_PARAO|nr:unnamed protein product [Parnassius apollo]
MEETQKGTRIGPLPGGRRGASGAGVGAAACGPPAECEELHDHLAAPRIHHPHQKAWCRLGLLGPSKRHPPLVEHVACVGQNP